MKSNALKVEKEKRQTYTLSVLEKKQKNYR